METPEFSSLRGARILVTGAHGFLGSRLCRILEGERATLHRVSRRTGYDLGDPDGAALAFADAEPDIAVHLAALCGGIGANMARPADFFDDNMRMGMNVVSECSIRRIRLVMVGTICSYPKDCPSPFMESSLWDGYPEPTNAPYGIAKKALLVMCQAHRAQYGLRFSYLMPCNLYGPGDNFMPSSSHVIPALIRKFEEGRRRDDPSVTCWGTGTATRSFLHVDDCARALALASASFEHDQPINLPGGPETTIRELAERVAGAVGYKGQVLWDASKPDGQPRRSVDGTRAKELLGWAPSIALEEGLRSTVSWWRAHSEERSGGQPT